MEQTDKSGEQRKTRATASEATGGMGDEEEHQDQQQQHQQQQRGRAVGRGHSVLYPCCDKGEDADDVEPSENEDQGEDCLLYTSPSPRD